MRAREKGLLVLLWVCSPLFFFCITEILNMHYPWKTLGIPFVFNILLFFSFICFAVAFTGRMIAGCYIASIFTYILGSVNFFVRMYKDSPLSVYDFYSVGTLLHVLSGGMELRINKIFVMATLSYICYWIALALFSKIQVCKRQISVQKRCLAAGYVVVIYFLIFGIGIFDKLGVDSSVFSAAKLNGFLVNFIQSYHEGKLSEPEGYDLEVVGRWLDEYVPDNTYIDEEMPNIIVIMNESFADMSYLGDFQTDTEVLEFYHGLENDVIRGYALSSVYGGNTANSEWEFLTGNSMLFMPKGSVPYQIYINNDVESLAKILNNIGYDSTALHPYPASSWNRKTVWKNLGFKETYFIDSYDSSRKEDFLDGKLTDRANYEYILEYIDGRESDAPLFLFNVTIQNHGGGANPVEDKFGYTIHLENGGGGK